LRKSYRRTCKMTPKRRRWKVFADFEDRSVLRLGRDLGALDVER
jgi:hypothetical protein